MKNKSNQLILISDINLALKLTVWLLTQDTNDLNRPPYLQVAADEIRYLAEMLDTRAEQLEISEKHRTGSYNYDLH